jgi:hypothetical protein
MANRRRNRPNGGGGGSYRPQHNKATVFDSNGPDVRIRGTAFQIVEKYMTLAKDAAASGDRVLAENYLQHAEHYQRLVGEMQEEQPRRFHNNGERGNYYGQNQGQGNTAAEETADADATPEPDVVVTRPTTPTVATEDDDLGLPASLVSPATLRAAAAG